MGMDDGVVSGNHVLAAGKQPALKAFRFFALDFSKKPSPEIHVPQPSTPKATLRNVHTFIPPAVDSLD